MNEGLAPTGAVNLRLKDFICIFCDTRKVERQ